MVQLLNKYKEKGAVQITTVILVACLSTLATNVVTRFTDTVFSSDTSHAEIEKQMTANVTVLKEENLKKNNEQDIDIAVTKTDISVIKADISVTKTDVKSINNKLDILLLDQGINPKTIK